MLEERTLFETIENLKINNEIALDKKRGLLIDIAAQAVNSLIERLTSSRYFPKSFSKKVEIIKIHGDDKIVKLINEFRHFKNSKTIDIESIAGLVLAIVNYVGCGDSIYSQRVSELTKIVNSVSIETVEGYKCFNLLHGDVLDCGSDLLVLSTHANPEKPLSGAVLKGIKQKLGIEVDPEKIFQIVRPGSIWICFQALSENDKFKNILTVRMKKCNEDAEFEAFYGDAIKGVFSAISSLEFQGFSFKTISLPVLYGSRIKDYSAAVSILLNNSITWLKKSENTRVINFVINENTELSSWDKALDRSLGRSFVNLGNNLILDSMIKEITTLIMNNKKMLFDDLIDPLFNSLNSQDPCVENVCVNGRKFAEMIVSELLCDNGLKEEKELMNNIEKLGREKIIAPWICSYMHGLRIFGNEMVHSKLNVSGYFPQKLNNVDFISGLSAIRALINFRLEYLKGRKSR